MASRSLGRKAPASARPRAMSPGSRCLISVSQSSDWPAVRLSSRPIGRLSGPPCTRQRPLPAEDADRSLRSLCLIQNCRDPSQARSRPTPGVQTVGDREPETSARGESRRRSKNLRYSVGEAPGFGGKGGVVKGCARRAIHGVGPRVSFVSTSGATSTWVS
jgi:hypothetical protein